MPYPDIDPVLISLGPLPIRWYALAYLTGIVLGAAYLVRLTAKPGLWGSGRGAPIDKPGLDDLVSWIIVGVIAGGRLGFLLFYRPELLFALTEVAGIPFPAALAVWEGGMSFHGGLLGVAVATFLFARRRDTDPFAIGDLLACAAPIGLFFGRIANFINAELYGRATDAPWGVVFPKRFDASRDEWVYGPLEQGFRTSDYTREGWIETGQAVARHPSQLYEAALEGLLLFAIIWFAVTRLGLLKKPGAATGLFLLGYGLSRFLVEFFREPDGYDFAGPVGFLTRGMMLSLPMAALGLYLLLKGAPSRHRNGVPA